ncbi:MAG: UDP-N-acetylmuramate dehydrogenase [Lachnospiraceae bacterium]
MRKDEAYKLVGEQLRRQFESIVGKENCLRQEPMSRHTTFQIGGEADYLLLPHSFEEIRVIIELCRQEAVPYFVIGKGSNLLVSDSGYRGVIIKMTENLEQITITGERIEAMAGITLRTLARKAQRAGLAGLEFAAGIPGTLGGAVMMNAGAYGGEMKDVLHCIRVLNEAGQILDIPVQSMEMGYRTSVVKTNRYVVLGAVLQLQKDDPVQINHRMQELLDRRNASQPLEYPSAGSTFKRPQGYYAGKLIMDTGLRGCQLGGAQVSEKHCGFVVNKEHATAQDVKALMDKVEQDVYERFGVMLEPEVRFLGEF